MNQKNTWKWLLIVAVVAFSIYKLYPPTGRDLIEVFKQEAVTQDAAFTSIVKQAEAARDEDKKQGIADNVRTYRHLRQAIGTNNLKPYFTTLDIPAKETDPNAAILNRLQRKAAGKIRLGLDLRGGTSFLVGVDTTALATNIDQSTAVSQAVEVLRRRVDKLGVAEPVLQKEGEDRILIQVPGISEAEKDEFRGIIERAAFLELRMVHPRSTELLASGNIPPDYEIKKEVAAREDGREPATYVVKRKAELNGNRIKQAFSYPDPVTGKPEIHFRLDAEGADIFARVTKQHQGEMMAIVLDGEVYSAPMIQSAITEGTARITGSFTVNEAHNLASVLENPLQAPVKILEERSVDPSLGKDSIRSGVWASIAGIVAVGLFMLVYYMMAGAIANVALILNILILMGVMCGIEATLTLPGIAGIVLTIGMAVDANVLIFERMREEFTAGKSLRGAINAGYNKAFGTIFDSNLTTLIAAVILIYMGTGPIKGFGVTLAIGIAVSMFTALFVTRLLFDWMLDRGMIKSLKMMNLIPEAGIDFMRWSKLGWAASLVLVLVGLGYGIFVRGHEVLGVDFAGGDTLTLRFDPANKIAVEKLRDSIVQLKVGEPQIQYQKDLSAATENLRITTSYESGNKVEEHLKTQFPNAKLTRVGLDKVGPTIGAEIQQTALVAALLSLFGILIYVAFRYEFSFAMGAVIAVLHDVLMTLGIFFLSGRELSAPMVAAILTIIGFSINDTIVIFDRIREDLKLGMRGSFAEIINKALNQTLSRTIITSGTVFLSTMALFIFGGGAIEDFAFTFLAGIITGVYSTIYIASAFVLWWHRGERPKMASSVATSTTVQGQGQGQQAQA